MTMILKNKILIFLVSIMLITACEDAAYYNKKIENKSGFDVCIIVNKKNLRITEKINQDTLFINSSCSKAFNSDDTEPDFGEYKSFDMFDTIFIMNNDSMVILKKISEKANWRLDVNYSGLFNNIKEYNYVFDLINFDVIHSNK